MVSCCNLGGNIHSRLKILIIFKPKPVFEVICRNQPKLTFHKEGSLNIDEQITGVFTNLESIPKISNIIPTEGQYFKKIFHSFKESYLKARQVSSNQDTLHEYPLKTCQVSLNRDTWHTLNIFQKISLGAKGKEPRETGMENHGF